MLETKVIMNLSSNASNLSGPICREITFPSIREINGYELGICRAIGMGVRYVGCISLK